ncbi:hypothetical protein [Bradyrhizobium brasilense]|uniref:hypothetical protein n=1 Tax=Bradyrhizobium brasilense TaxID=1419277 RepID=UPI00115FAE72|nr:hypothetical protein [Bradyrhizobium brasilense]
MGKRKSAHKPAETTIATNATRISNSHSQPSGEEAVYCIGGGASWPIWATSPVGRALIDHGVMPLANDLVVQLCAKLDQFQSDMNQVGDIADAAVARIEQSFANLNPTMGGFASLGVAAAGVTEPPRVCRRPFGLSYAAMADCSSMA